ncbi:MAG: asparagine synthase (glutamine-hydrolyzing), partial [Chitinophagaceae bacterium]
MCGIAGILSPDQHEISNHRLKLMTDAIAHRGPDGEATWIDDKFQVGLGHRRLAIIDLGNGGRQPMHYGKRFTIVFNGEIYNYLELKKELIARGCDFHSESDTEVILAAYSVYKEDCLRHFDGMFSFAIWDENEQQLFAARDRFGEKPFYFHYEASSHTLLFASEMKSLWAAGVPREIDHRMMLTYLSLGYVQNPANSAETFFQQIFSLSPSTYLIYSAIGRGVKISQYYVPVKTHFENAPDLESASAQFSALFSASVSQRLRSDVSVGASLSGGLDSSSIVSMIGSLTPPEKFSLLSTFSAVFPGFDKDESQHIRRIVQYKGIKNFQVEPTASQLLKDFQKICHHQEEPFPSSSIYTQYRVYELAKLHGVTVLLDGQGADEVLAGYPKYIHWYLQELISTGRKSKVNSELSAFSQTHPNLQWSWRNKLAAIMPVSAARALSRKARRAVIDQPDITGEYKQAYTEESRFTKPVIRNLENLLTYNRSSFGLEELLRFSDRNSMAHGCEVRLPFLYHPLVEFVSALPSEMKFHQGFGKYLLRFCMKTQLPPEIC